MNIKFEVVKYLETDVIATSGEYVVAGMTPKSYQLYGDVIGGPDYHVCCWYLNNTTSGKSGRNFSYFDENGQSINVDLEEDGWVVPIREIEEPTGKWFHYVPDASTYILCNDPNHHDNN